MIKESFPVSRAFRMLAERIGGLTGMADEELRDGRGESEIFSALEDAVGGVAHEVEREERHLAGEAVACDSWSSRIGAVCQMLIHHGGKHRCGDAEWE